METLRDYSQCPAHLRGAVLAIGNFDGVHRGHQAVIAAARDEARRQAAASGVMTFEPHPRTFFRPEEPLFRLTPEPLKLRLLAALGVDFTLVVPFNAALASMSARTFVSRILVEGLNVRHVVTGADFHFGKGREGTPEMLARLGEELGFGVTCVSPQGQGGAVYSSSRVRECLRNGDIEGAAAILGYWWRVQGHVVDGDKRGHGLGFPTANVRVPEGFGLKHGIYAVRVNTAQGRFGGAAYLGTRPSFDDGEPVIETFLFDFAGDLYDQEIELEFIAFLRDDRKFETAEALRTQMAADCEAARRRLEAIAASDPYGSFPPRAGGDAP
ncbi:MAG: bifunctional riboflavin kinase/FAD synthetase [Methyloligellaceae bacterium]